MSSSTERETMKIEDLAWLAGIIDGEGCILIVKHKREERKRPFSFTLRLAVQTADSIMIPECFKITKIGTVTACKRSETSSKKWSHILKWQVHGKKASYILRELLPYLRVKKSQAELAIKFQDQIKSKYNNISDDCYNNQVEIYEQMQKEKHLVKVPEDFNKVLLLI